MQPRRVPSRKLLDVSGPRMLALLSAAATPMGTEATRRSLRDGSDIGCEQKPPDKLFPIVRPQSADAGVPLARRPRLLFNHNPKAGGGSLLLYFQQAIGPVCQNQTTATPYCYVHVREPCWTGTDVRRNFFVIGGVREPCDHYVSLWAFGSDGHGAFSQKCRSFSNDSKTAEYCGTLGTAAPRFDSATDVLRFQQWVQHPLVMGVIARRFQQSYIDNDGAAHVDCWVVTDRFVQTLVGCLRAFEAQGGRVDWKRLAAFDQKLNTSTLTASTPPPMRPPLPPPSPIRPPPPPLSHPHYSKNSVTLTDPRDMHHAPCSHYFDEKMAHAIEHGPDAALYNDFRGSGVGRFGFHGCCKGSS